MKKILSLFLDHPKSVNETYAKHFFQALMISFTLIKLSLTALIHAIFPFLFIETTSINIEKLNNKTSKRRKKNKISKSIQDSRFIRDRLYDYGSVTIECEEKGIIYKSEYCTKKKSIEESRILWMKTIKEGLYLLLPPDISHPSIKMHENDPETIIENQTKRYYEQGISEIIKQPILEVD